MNNKGAYLVFRGSWNPEKKKFMQKTVPVEKAEVVCLPGGWIPVMDI